MRTNNGAIQLSRSIYDSEIWRKPSDWLKIWIFILGNVNFQDKNLFKRGENFFKYDVIALDCGCSINIVNKCIKFLITAEQIQSKKTSRGAILKVVNYNKYQDLCNYGRIEAEQKQNRSRIGTNTIIEECNNEKNDNNIISKDITKQEFGNEEINHMQDIIKQTIEDNGMIYKPGKYERARITNIINGKDFGNVCEKNCMTREVFVINIINLASKLQYSKQINNACDLYEHYASVYNKALKTKQEILQPKRMIG